MVTYVLLSRRVRTQNANPNASMFILGDDTPTAVRMKQTKANTRRMSVIMIHSTI